MECWKNVSDKIDSSVKRDFDSTLTFNSNQMEFLGRLHPVVLHLPIGFLVLAFLMEWSSRRSLFKSLEPAVRFALFFGMITAILSAVFGYWLSLEGGYDENLLVKHQNLGFLTAGLSVLVYGLKTFQNGKFQLAYDVSFVVLMLVLTLAGHFGGSLTHGADYLFKSSNEDVNVTAGIDLSNLDTQSIYKLFIQPILKKKCESCHNVAKEKGELILSDTASIAKGGKNGAVLVHGNPSESSLFTRLLLPIHEKKHMPPKGKQQLEKSEIDLLKWWIEEGGDFEKRVGACHQPKHIKAIFEEKFRPKDVGVFALNVPKASENTILSLRKKGIRIISTGKDQPFLMVDLSNRKDLKKKDIQRLSKIRKQIIALDLGNSNVAHSMLSGLKKMPHLTQVHLENTAITDKTIAYLKNAKYLKYLNIYKTSITDKGLKHLTGLNRLENIYLWQTATTQKGIAQLKKTLPKLKVHQGADALNIFKTSNLNPPQIAATGVIFKDSTKISLQHNFPNSTIRYTLDGSEPDSLKSLEYKDTLLITNSVTIKAQAFAEGWQASEVISRDLFQTKYKAAKVTLTSKPADSYNGKGEKEAALIDFKKGSQFFKDGRWLGWQGKNVTITITMKKSLEVSMVSIGTLEDIGSWIFYPKFLEVYLADSKQTFKKIKRIEVPRSAKDAPPSRKNFKIEFPTQKAKFVKVKVFSQLKNPSWHPTPGGESWVFLDEILVE